jgi:hypothetical protein
MSRKRSLKERYFRFLRRIWPVPTLAALSLVGSCASRPMPSVSRQTDPLPVTAVGTRPSNAMDELRFEWQPQLLPTELQLAPEFRSACAPIVALPATVTLKDEDEVLDALEPIAACVTLGPLARQPLHLLGPSDLPGRWDAPITGSGRADQRRSSLNVLGVPFDELVTHDVDSGNEVELGADPGSS